MGVSPVPLYGNEFPQEQWSLQDEVSPFSAASQERTPQSVSEQSMQENCCIRDISSSIDSDAKAKVVAIMAMHLFVYDAQLDTGRDRWACPFTTCKESFLDKIALMRHVPICHHFSGEAFYCNCCCSYYDLSDRGPTRHFGYGAGASSSDKDSGNSTTSKAMRRLSNFFTRSRSASRSSLRGSCCTMSPIPSPVSTPDHRPRPVANTAPVPPKTPHRQTGIYLPELPNHELMSTPATSPRQEKSLHPSAPHELLDTSTVAELPCSQMNVEESNSYASSSNTAPPLSIDTLCPIFTGAVEFTESPEEDIPHDSKIPTSAFYQQDNSNPFHEHSHVQYSALSNPQIPTRPIREHELVSCWNSSTDSDFSFQFGPQQPQDIVQDVVPSAADTAIDSQTGVATLFAGPFFQHAASSSNQPSISSQSRHGSGDSCLSDMSQPFQAARPPQTVRPPGLNQMYCALSELQQSHPSPPFESSPVEMEDYHCPYCSYRPGGDVSHRKDYLKKHIFNMHEAEPIPCPDCGIPVKRQWAAILQIRIIAVHPRGGEEALEAGNLTAGWSQ
ncbi:hypothetical protein F66182_8173 [Fusarium sp. NRRL 66182]|nr:hypothetical protein F66182_8173 [Fusarium sp. NRRL 66182]